MPIAHIAVHHIFTHVRDAREQIIFMQLDFHHFSTEHSTEWDTNNRSPQDSMSVRGIHWPDLRHFWNILNKTMLILYYIFLQIVFNILSIAWCCFISVCLCYVSWNVIEWMIHHVLQHFYSSITVSMSPLILLQSLQRHDNWYTKHIAQLDESKEWEERSLDNH